MSYRYLNATWELELPAHLKIVLLSLADQANDDGECWPSQAYISKRCGTSTRQVGTNLRKLREMGLVEMVKRRRRKTAVYRITLLDEQDQKPASGQGEPPTSVDHYAHDRNHTSSETGQDRKSSAPKTGSPLPTNHKGTTTQIEPPSSLAPTGAHEVEVVEEDGHTYEVQIAGRNPHDAMTYTLVYAMDWKPEEVTEAQWGAIHRAAKELLKRGADPHEVPVRGYNYRMNHPDWSLTPSALVKWWADSAEIRLSPSRGQVADLAAAAERRQWRNR